jgi:arsenical-resistance protein 2
MLPSFASLRPAVSLKHLTNMPELPWHATLPAPRATLAQNSLKALSIEELAVRMRTAPASRKDLLVVDVRRTDFEVGCPAFVSTTFILMCRSQNGFVRGAINLPAQSFYPTLPSLMPLLMQCSRVVYDSYTFADTRSTPDSARWFFTAKAPQGGGHDARVGTKMRLRLSEDRPYRPRRRFLSAEQGRG